MFVNTSGIILSRRPYKEHRVFLSVYTDVLGLIDALVYETAKNISETEIFTYAEFCFKHRKNSRNGNSAEENSAVYTVNSVRIIYSFHNLSANLKGLSLASYFAELIKCTSISDMPETNGAETVRFIAVSLFTIMKPSADFILIKALFELRRMRQTGHAPNLVACNKCGEFKADLTREIPEDMYFSVSDECIFCKDCVSKDSLGLKNRLLLCSPVTLHLMRQAIFAETDKLYSVKADKEHVLPFSGIAENYFFSRTEASDRTIRALEYYSRL